MDHPTNPSKPEVFTLRHTLLVPHVTKSRELCPTPFQNRKYNVGTYLLTWCHWQVVLKIHPTIEPTPSSAVSGSFSENNGRKINKHQVSLAKYYNTLNNFQISLALTLNGRERNIYENQGKLISFNQDLQNVDEISCEK